MTGPIHLDQLARDMRQHTDLPDFTVRVNLMAQEPVYTAIVLCLADNAQDFREWCEAFSITPTLEAPAYEGRNVLFEIPVRIA